MKKITMILAIAFLSSACSKKEDAPQASVPHVAGSWSGSGTDDVIGYYNLSANLAQSGDAASGTFTMAGAAGTISGGMVLTISPAGGNNLQAMSLTREQWSVANPANASRLCSAAMTVKPGSTFITGSAVTFSYSVSDCQGGTWFGGASLQKTAGTN